ncbi:MAG: aminoacyl-tRNA hydrolase [Chloroflexi bacterium]|nr:aminoacyl-tRNA hydrolase [Chloroflexota bacterium]
MMAVLGLGNPGRAYARSRHNVGFQCVSLLGRKHGISLGQRRRDVVLGEGSIQGEQVVLAKPRTYVNLSGVAARYLQVRYNLPSASLLVVHDDMALPLGKLRIRPRGSSAGHNGIKSIIASLDTQEFPRLRIGVGRPQGQGAVSFVLGRFAPGEVEVMEEAVDRATDAVAWILQYGLDSAMDRFN